MKLIQSWLETGIGFMNWCIGAFFTLLFFAFMSPIFLIIGLPILIVFVIIGSVILAMVLAFIIAIIKIAVVIAIPAAIIYLLLKVFTKE